MAGNTRSMRHVTARAVACMVLSLLAGRVALAEPGPDPAPVPMPPVVSLADVARLDDLRLELLFRNGHADAVPEGKAAGLAMFPGDASPRLDRMANALWKGKTFTRTGSSVIVDNDVAGGLRIRATASRGRLEDVRAGLRREMLDERPSVLLDYSKHRPQPFSTVVDEMRLVNRRHGLWLGRATDHGRFLCWFALQFDAPVSP